MHLPREREPARRTFMIGAVEVALEPVRQVGAKTAVRKREPRPRVIEFAETGQMLVNGSGCKVSFQARPALDEVGLIFLACNCDAGPEGEAPCACRT